MTPNDPASEQATKIRTLIITLLPETLRSSVLLDAHQTADWMDSSICLGIPKGDSRDDLEAEIDKAGLPKPPEHVFDILSRSEVGCIYAHLRALAIASKSDSPTLILEDDAWFEPATLKEIVTKLDWMPDDAILKLEGDDKPGGRIVFGPKHKNFRFALSMRPSNGSAGYIVTSISASRLLAAGYGYGHAYDMLLNDPTLHGCLLLDAVPFPIRPSIQAVSTISRGKKRPGFLNKMARHSEKLKRRVGRYRMQVLRAQRQRYFRVRFAKFYEN